jgi:aryl-alcohol dehydrogenase-like predicted oxidoreductase
VEYVELGATGMMVSRLGFGASEIGFQLDIEEGRDTAERLLNTALDGGINYFDTAACYDTSEEMLGRCISHRRGDFYLGTKAGHITGESSGDAWSYGTIIQSIDRSLRRMRTEYLDLIQLHSCGLTVLRRGDAIRALEDARRAGKVRYLGYSGDNEEALWAVESGLFNTLQTSFNVVDQSAREKLFPAVLEKSMGLIAKRPVANGVWGQSKDPKPYAHDPGYTAEYFRRTVVMASEAAGAGAPAAGVPGTVNPQEAIQACIGFVLAHPEVHTAIVGTRNPAHLASNLAFVEAELPLTDEIVRSFHDRFRRVSNGWRQQR